MPAPTTTLNSVEFLLKAAGNSVGGGTGGSLTINRTAEETTSDLSARVKTSIPGVTSWNLTFDTLHQIGGVHLNGKDVSVTVSGVALKGITEASLALACGVGEVVNSTTGLARTLDPQVRSGSLTVSADYYDPLGTGAAAFGTILDELLGVTSAGLAVVFSIGGMSFAFTGRPTTTSVNKSLPDILKAGITFESTGPITPTMGTSNAGIAALYTALLAAPASTPVSVLAGTATVGSTEFSGSGYCTALTLTVPISSPVKVSGTIEGSGALTKAPKAA